MDQPSSSASARLLGLLRSAYVARLSGHLHVTHGDERRGLTIREGQIVHGRSDRPGEHLSDVLVRQGFLSQADVDRAVEAALAERRPLGAVLADLGLIDRVRLEEAVGCHVREILFGALDEPGGSSSFEELESLPEDTGDPASHLSTGQVLLEAARRLQDPAIVHEALGDQERKLVPATDPRLRAHPVALTPTDGFVLSRVDGTLSARDLIGLIPLPAEDTERSLLGLLCTGAIDFAPDRPSPRRAPAPRAPASSPPQNLPPPSPPPPSPPPPSTPPPSPPPSAPPPTPERPPVVPASSAAPGPASAPPQAAAPAPVEPSPPKRSPEEVRRLILETYDSLGRRDHFQLLGVRPGVSAEELRASYAQLARVLHPDACRDPLLADVDDKREAAFLGVRTAYEILRKPETRAEHEADLRRRRPRLAPATAPAANLSDSFSPPPPRSDEAPSPSSHASSPLSPPPPGPSLEERLEETIAKGEELLREGQYWEAIQQIEPTLQHARGPLAVRARLALARASLKNPQWLKKAEAHLQAVLHEEPTRVEAYLLLGDIYRDSNLPVRATTMYRKAVELQPGDRHALREIARLEGAQSPPPGGGSLLGFLKKR